MALCLVAAVRRAAAVPLLRSLSSTPVVAAGQAHRLRTGRSRSGTEYGPLVDSPDWSYADSGEAAPPTLRQTERQRTRERKQVKIAIQLQEMRQGLKADTDRSTQSLGIAQMDFIPGKPTKPTA